MKSSNLLLAMGLLGALATLVPEVADARPRGGGFHAGGARIHAGGIHRGGMVRPGWHGHGTRWASGGRYYRGGYYRRGYGYPVAAGVAAGAALGAAAAYGSSYGSCYQTQSVWNGYTYVNQTVRVC